MRFHCANGLEEGYIGCAARAVVPGSKQFWAVKAMSTDIFYGESEFDQ